jgi:hypothetical protein
MELAADAPVRSRWMGVTFNFVVFRLETGLRNECRLRVSLSPSALHVVAWWLAFVTAPFGDAGLKRSSTVTSISTGTRWSDALRDKTAQRHTVADLFDGPTFQGIKATFLADSYPTLTHPPDDIHSGTFDTSSNR